MIDTASEPGAYADALRFAPWIADERDGTVFRNLPARFEQRRNSVEGGEQRLPAFAPVVPCLHANPTKPEGQPDHG